MSYRDLLAEAAARRNAEQALAKAEAKLNSIRNLIDDESLGDHLYPDDVRQILDES